METYPLEYVLHHVPLMAVIGLLDPPPSQQPADTLQQQSQPSPVRKALLTSLMAKNNASIWDSGGRGVGFFHVIALDKVFNYRMQNIR
jgi:hypothetical protein